MTSYMHCADMERRWGGNREEGEERSREEGWEKNREGWVREKSQGGSDGRDGSDVG